METLWQMIFILALAHLCAILSNVDYKKLATLQHKVKTMLMGFFS